jgi:hypothetical protein
MVGRRTRPCQASSSTSPRGGSRAPVRGGASGGGRYFTPPRSRGLTSSTSVSSPRSSGRRRRQESGDPDGSRRRPASAAPSRSTIGGHASYEDFRSIERSVESGMSRPTRLDTRSGQDVRETRALDGLDLRWSGEVHGFLGPNGAGSPPPCGSCWDDPQGRRRGASVRRRPVGRAAAPPPSGPCPATSALAEPAAAR